MKERPILFSGPMVLAILEGRKTQTRRIVKPQPFENGRLFGPELYQPVEYDRHGEMVPGKSIYGAYSEDGEWGVKCPYGAPGDRLWVKETFFVDTAMKKIGSSMMDDLYYRADGECCQQIPECACAEVGKPKWRPSIHMPRWASRITLEVTSVRIERLQEISEQDAMAEGAKKFKGKYHFLDSWEGELEKTPQAAFRKLWNQINGPDAWDQNPWVWVVEFKRVDARSVRREVA